MADGTKVGELTLDIGLKGDNKAKQGLKGVKDGLGEVKESGLLAKAALVGVLYELEHMMSASAKIGLGLQNFADYTGESTEQLQRFQIAFMKTSGVAKQETESTVRSLTNMLNKARIMGADTPGYGILASHGFDISKAFDKKGNMDMKYVFGQLQGYLKNEKDTGIANWAAEGFLTPNMIAALRRGDINKTAAEVPNSMIKSDKAISSQARVEIQWQEIWEKVEKGFADLTAKHGPMITTEIDHLVTAFIGLANALLVLSEKTHIIDLLAKSVGVIASIGGTTATLLGGNPKDRKNLADKRIATIKQQDTRPLYQKWGLDKKVMEVFSSSPATMAKKPSPSPATGKPNVNINITHHGDAKDTQAVKDVHASAARTLINHLDTGQIA